jgi:hypothetical protein
MKLLLLFFLIGIGNGKNNPDSNLTNAFAQNPAVKTLFLSDSQKTAIEKSAHARLASRLITYYEGVFTDSSSGYVIPMEFLIRTLPANVNITVTSDGVVKKVEVTRFLEPPDYRPPARWLDLFSGKTVLSTMKVNQDIPIITGATITAEAFTANIRLAVALLTQQIIRK